MRVSCLLRALISARPCFTWRWAPDNGAAFVGDLTWPDSSDVAESHAASLLAVAEEAFIDGCPPGRIPSVSVSTSREVRNLNEVPAERRLHAVGQIRIADTGLILAARRAGSQLAASTAVRRTAAVVTSVSGS